VTILIADDDPVSRRLLESTLERLGHEVVAVADGREALDIMLRIDGPHLAILDWDMPGVDGPAVCRAIRARPVPPYVYIVLLTARDRQEDMVAGLDAEADDFLRKPLNVVELAARLRSGERVLALQANLLKAHEALRQQATYDHLTGLYNRAAILDYLHKELLRIRRTDDPLAIAIADVDHFKHINDTYGHSIGDSVLKNVAGLMRSVLRDYERVGRYGGEEFLVVFTGCDATAARIAAERARKHVATQSIEVGGLRLQVTLSIGLSWTGVSGGELETLILDADEALYRAKACGRNRVEAWTHNKVSAPSGA
jgi:two-component system cell cycle response regulator